MSRDDLIKSITEKKSFLCVGLDTDIKKIPKHLLSSDDPVYEFNKFIVDATIDYAIAYKPNLAFYESLGPGGLESLEKTMEFIPDDVFTIADAKRGDIGNSSQMYARAFFERMDFDSITVSPYMGHDSILPYFEYKGKWAIVLALTSNPGSKDFQHLDIAGDHDDFFDVEEMELFELVVKRISELGTKENLMFVVGATKTSYMKHIRNLVPDHFLLVPGIGAQGGNLEEVASNGINSDCGLIVSASRSIIYASDGDDFASMARKSSMQLRDKMSELLQRYM